MPKLIIADIDGCCLDPNERIHHFLNDDIATYHANWHVDTPIAQGVAMYRMLINNPEYQLVFVTGRQEAAREYTLTQLQVHVDSSITSSQLLMRPNHISGKDIHDTDMKPILINEAGYKLEDIFMVFEDRNSVVDMWRQRGITCYQTQLGDF